jgi:hypothetical protein
MTGVEGAGSDRICARRRALSRAVIRLSGTSIAAPARAAILVPNQTS